MSVRTSHLRDGGRQAPGARKGLTPTAGLPSRILVATDGSEASSLAVRAAADLASRANAELHLVHVRQRFPVQRGLPYSAHLERAVEDHAASYAEETEQLMRRRAFEARAEGADVTDVHLPEGREAEEIAGLAGELSADLLVIGRRRFGSIKRLLVGSVSEGVVGLARCPTLVVCDREGAWPPSGLIVGDDASEEARRAGEVAASIGGLLGLRALLVRAYPSVTVFKARRVMRVRSSEEILNEGRKVLERRAAKLRNILGARPEIAVASGDPAAVIREAAEEGGEPSLVAVGRRGPGAAKRFALGSVSMNVLRTASGPVLIVPPVGEGLR